MSNLATFTKCINILLQRTSHLWQACHGTRLVWYRSSGLAETGTQCCEALTIPRGTRALMCLSLMFVDSY